MGSAADGAIVGASIRTLDPDRPWASALAWRDGVLIAVGEDVGEHIGPRTRVIDGAGMAVVPGLTDSHIHPFWGTRLTRGVDLRDAGTLDEIRARLATAPREGEWVLAHSAHYEPFHESGLRADAIEEALDGAPAVIHFFDAHTSLASFEALRRAGITGARAFEEAAEIVVDQDGTPTGALLENAAMDLVNAVVPDWTDDERLDAYAETMRRLNAVGLTGGHVMLGDPWLLDDVRALEGRKQLTLRIVVPMHQEPAISDEEVEHRLGLADERGRLWRTGTAKFFLDGVLESGTAWLLDPGPNGENAHPFWPSVERYAELVARFTDAGFSAITHAVGDGAVNGALNAYEAAGPPRRGMHRVEHIETLVDSDLPRFTALNVAASMQPLHMEGLDDPDAPSAWHEGLSAGRAERGFRSGDLVRSGATLPLGSDWMVADFDPRYGMAWARLRRTPGEPTRVPYLPGQALSALQTLDGYTTHAARVNGDEQVYGRLHPGLRADITAFAQDPVETDPDELPDVPVLLTVVDGHVVFAAH
ncbi:amidohydrolase [Solirubrobacter soli]|uniref:amidohydrolase n=1 Tax=Solirubrobacter soli TaxID=363832 RepID=UPI000406A7AB|nr:amidohydrolase [Solirubrobacter soli]